MGVKPYLFLSIRRIEVWPHFDCVEAQCVLLVWLRSDDPDLGIHELAQQRRPQDQSRLLLPSTVSQGLTLQQCVVNISQGEGHIIIEPLCIRCRIVYGPRFSLVEDVDRGELA